MMRNTLFAVLLLLMMDDIWAYSFALMTLQRLRVATNKNPTAMMMVGSSSPGATTENAAEKLSFPDANDVGTGWDKTIDTISSDGISRNNLECSIDKQTGLRGLKWKTSLSDSRSSTDDVACSIPIKNLVIADKDDDNHDELEALMYKLNSILLSKSHPEQVKEAKDTHGYLETLPESSDLSLMTIGTNWDNFQLERLGHAPTIAKLKSLRKDKANRVQRILQTNSNISSFSEGYDELLVVANWAHDLVMSRALVGPFGQRGKIRALVLASAASGLLSTAPLLQGILQSTVSIEDFLPLVCFNSFFMVFGIYFFRNKKATEELAMVPWIDMANHKSNTASFVMKLQYNIWNNCVEWVRKVETEPSISTSAPPLDELNNIHNNDSLRGWITYDYGGKRGITNDKLLANYGFVEAENPNDRLEIQIYDDNAIDEAPEVAILGRFGKVIEKNGAVWQNSTLTNANVVDAVSKQRDRLHSVSRSSKTLYPVEKGNAIDEARAKLASSWRREKIRLLDEFLAKHDSLK